MTAAAEGGSLRLDKWLWHARFYKSRALAARVCETRRIRVNGMVVGKAHYLLRTGDTLTFVWNDRVRIVRVVALGSRRGPAAEARELYLEIDVSQRDDGVGPGDPCGQRRESPVGG